MAEIQRFEILEDEQIGQMKVVDLRTELSRRGMRIYGRKKELIARLRSINAIHREHAAREGDTGIEAQDDDDENDEDDDSGDVADENQLATPRNALARGTSADEHVVRRISDFLPDTEDTSKARPDQHTWHRSPQITFRDVEDAVENFSGDDHDQSMGE
ncbi:hypothetical protein PV325_010913 [Microctonus aethiopoides]|nr:hypothetical protein PV325_010913 [Microctonus aethiopoides]KAK0074714.1 hypothetical protein PV326_012220 [Microctonus aethiopoides]